MYFFKKNTFFLFLAFNLSPYRLSPLTSRLSPIARLRASYNLITSKVFTFALSYGRYTLT